MNLCIGLTRDHPALNNSRQFPGVGAIRRSLVECRGDQYCTDSAAQIQAVLYQIDGPDHMLTSIECRSQAEEKITQAEREPRHRTRLLTAAQAWLILAGQMRRLEIAISGTGEVRSKIRAD